MFGLLVAAASFGVLQLLFGGSSPLLGGPGYLDPMSIIGIFTVAFGVTTTFSALLLMRTRDEYVSGVEGTSAVRIGLRETGAAATGAGLVMVASLIPFLTTSFVNVQQFGIGVAVAVLLDVLDRASRLCFPPPRSCSGALAGGRPPVRRRPVRRRPVRRRWPTCAVAHPACISATADPAPSMNRSTR